MCNYQFAYAAWDDLKQAIDRLPDGSKCYWVPSHGKKVDWMPYGGYNAKRIRGLNDEADKAAGDAAKEGMRGIQSWLDEVTVAKRWVSRALGRLHAAEEEYMDRCGICAAHKGNDV